MQARIWWHWLEDDADPLWKLGCGLYAYVATGRPEILYIGKADGTTVRQRWQRRGHKEAFWNDLEHERGIFGHAVIAGEVELD